MKCLFAIFLLPLSIAANASIYVRLVQSVNAGKTNKVAIFSDNILLPTKNRNTYKQNDEMQNNATSTLYSWHNTIDTIKLSAKTLYTHNFQNDTYPDNNNGIVLTIKKYDFSFENALEKQNDKIQHLSSQLHTSLPLELTDSKEKTPSKGGSDYKIWQNFTLSTDANINVDSIASTLQLLGTVGYRF